MTMERAETVEVDLMVLATERYTITVPRIQSNGYQLTQNQSFLALVDVDSHGL